MTQPYVEVRRKNLGEQFTVVDTKTHFVLHWIRPGDRLPQYVSNYPDIFEITQEDIDKAAVLQRTRVYGIEGGHKFRPHGAQDNAKGTVFAYKATRWERLKCWVNRQIDKLKGVFV